MGIIISGFVLLLSCLMFVLPESKKLGLILFSSICLESFTFSYVSFGACNKMLCLFFFFSEVSKLNYYKMYLKNSIIGKLILIATVGTFFLIIYSTHAHKPTTFVGLIVNDLITKYYVLAYVFVRFKKYGTLTNFYKIVTVGIFLLTFFGILNLITKTSIIADITGHDGTKFVNLDRMRVTSMFSYAFDYGFCCCVLSIFALYGKKTNSISSPNFIFIFFCTLLGTFICGCRSVIVVEAVMLAVYIVVMFKPIKSFFIIIGACLLLGISYISIPSIREKAQTVATAFDSDNQEMGESSIFMRVVQFSTVLYQIQGHELLGRGYRYFIEDLGYDKNGNGFRDLPSDAQTLMGLEGATMGILLERGYIGLAVYLIYYGGLFLYTYKLRHDAKLEAACGMSTLIGFTLYANMTGELASSIISIFFIGLFLKLATINDMSNKKKHLISNV